MITPQATLRESLELLAPMIPEALLPEEKRPELLDLGERLPPVHFAGFEARLGPAGGVDLQQAIDLDFRLIERLEHWIAVQPPTATGKLLGGFIGLWRRSSRVQEAVRQIWLELDRDSGVTSLPSFFLTLNGDDAGDQAPALEEVQQWLRQRMGLKSAVAPEAVIDRAPVTHVGYLLRAGLPRQRFICPLPRLGNLPDRLGTAPQRTLAEQLVSRLSGLENRFAEFRWCKDAHANESGRVSIEAFFPRERNELDQLFHLLRQRNWIPEPQLEGLSEWPGILTPEHHPGSWPGNLILDSLRRPDRPLGIIERRLGHLKFSLAFEGEMQAKAYFGYRPRWLGPAGS